MKMKYYEEEGKCKIGYEVEMDEEKLREIKALLDRECFVIKHGRRFESAYNEQEAAEKIIAEKNYGGISKNIDFHIFGLTEEIWSSHGDPLFAEYNAVYRDSVGLSSIIYWLLDKENCEEEKEDNKYNKMLLERLQDYGNSTDFLPFEKRIEIASKKLEQAISENNGILNAVEEYGEACIEARLNKNFNFKKLMELYRETLSCIKINTIEDTIIYTPRSK